MWHKTEPRFFPASFVDRASWQWHHISRLDTFLVGFGVLWSWPWGLQGVMSANKLGPCPMGLTGLKGWTMGLAACAAFALSTDYFLHQGWSSCRHWTWREIKLESQTGDSWQLMRIVMITCRCDGFAFSACWFWPPYARQGLHALTERFQKDFSTEQPKKNKSRQGNTVKIFFIHLSSVIELML